MDSSDKSEQKPPPVEPQPGSSRRSPQPNNRRSNASGLQLGGSGIKGGGNTSTQDSNKSFVFSSKPRNKKLKLIENTDRALAEVLQKEEDAISAAVAASLKKSVGIAAAIVSDESDENMESSEEYEDSGNESSGEDVEFAMEREERGSNERNPEDEYPFTVLSTKDIVEHMVDSIREVRIQFINIHIALLFLYLKF